VRGALKSESRQSTGSARAYTALGLSSITHPSAPRRRVRSVHPLALIRRRLASNAPPPHRLAVASGQRVAASPSPTLGSDAELPSFAARGCLEWLTAVQASCRPGVFRLVFGLPVLGVVARDGSPFGRSTTARCGREDARGSADAPGCVHRGQCAGSRFRDSAPGTCRSGLCCIERSSRSIAARLLVEIKLEHGLGAINRTKATSWFDRVH